MAYKVERTEEEWLKVLGREAYLSLRDGVTERPWSGEYVENTDSGIYLCKACDAALFRSETKYTAHCGWPAFSYPVESSVVETEPDTSQGMRRTRVRCATCGSHLGYLFEDGPEDMGGKRFCINSIGLLLQTTDADEDAGHARAGVSSMAR
jgi:peptide-methionine (R)-S-oxide reductase